MWQKAMEGVENGEGVRGSEDRNSHTYKILSWKASFKNERKKYFNVFYGNNTTKGIYFIKNILIL